MTESVHPFPALVACVDAGSNGIRGAVARFDGPQRYETVYAERLPIRLGHEVFLTGKLGDDTMDRALAGFAEFRRRFDELQVQAVRAVGTSALREARNGPEFLERVRSQTGLAVETVSGAEEARLVHLAVGSRVPLVGGQWLLVDLGGGSVEVMLADVAGIHWVESTTLGSVRLLEELTSSGDDPGRFVRLLEDYAGSLEVPTRGEALAGYVATGGNVESLAKLAGAEADAQGVRTVSLDRLDRLIARLATMSYQQRVDDLDLRPDRADVILPASIIYAKLGRLAGVDRIHVPGVGVKDGILLDLALGLTTSGRPQELSSAELAGVRTLADKYRSHRQRAERVTTLALSLFDQTAPLHGLGPDHRRMLQAAALLHDVGRFIAASGYHKHTLYVLLAAGVPGFNERQTRLLANVARYHRKSVPKGHHDQYQKMNDEDRAATDRLASLLRLAAALEGHSTQPIRSVRAQLDDEVTLHVAGEGDLLLESWSVKQDGDLFRQTFDRKVVVRPA